MQHDPKLHDWGTAQDVLTKDARDRSAPELLAHAARRGGKTVMQVTRDYWRLHRGQGKMTLQEYVRYGLWDDARFSQDDKDRFVSNSLHWALTDLCSDRTWDALTEDKYLSGTFMQAAGLPVPETLAVIDRGQRLYGHTRKIATGDDLRDFLTGLDEPVFGKVQRGICSLGAFWITGGDATHVHFRDREPATYDDFVGKMLGPNPYLLQRIVHNHPAIDGICSATATLRMVNMVRKDDIFTPQAAIKIPGGDAIADAFWREGNLACDVDPATGRINTIVDRSDLDLIELEAHPSGRKLIGEHLPDWDKVLDLNERAARHFAPVGYQSFDIALSPDGPVIVEINTGSGFDLPQHAGRKGILTDEVRDFFRACGSRHF